MLLRTGSKLLVLDDEANKEKNKRETNSSSEENNGKSDLDHYDDLFISDGKVL